MKKILLALIMMVSFSFAYTFPSTYIYDGYNYTYLFDSTINESGSATCYGSDCSTRVSVINAYRIEVSFFQSLGTSDDFGNTYAYLHAAIYQKGSAVCSSPKIIVDGQCVCPSGYVEGSESNTCVQDCSKNPDVNVPIGWHVFFDKSETDCTSYINSTYYKTGSFNTTSSGECTYNVCLVNDYSPDPCTPKGWSYIQPPGYIFKGKVTSDAQCSQYVDGINYYNYKVLSI